MREGFPKGYLFFFTQKTYLIRYNAKGKRVNLLKPILTTQSILFLSRNTIVDCKACFRDDQTNEIVCFDLASLIWNVNNDQWQLADYTWNSDNGIYQPTEQNDYNEIKFEFSEHPDFLVESHFYDLEITNKITNEVYYKDRVFVTAQTIEQTENKYYKISKGDYVTPPEVDADFVSRNDYIVL